MVKVTPLSKVANTLGLLGNDQKHHIAIVGGGGKTTLMHAIGKQLQGKVILTTTTKMGSDQNEGMRTLLNPRIEEIDAIDTKSFQVLEPQKLETTKEIATIFTSRQQFKGYNLNNTKK